MFLSLLFVASVIVTDSTFSVNVHITHSRPTYSMVLLTSTLTTLPSPLHPHPPSPSVLLTPIRARQSEKKMQTMLPSCYNQFKMVHRTLLPKCCSTASIISQRRCQITTSSSSQSPSDNDHVGSGHQYIINEQQQHSPSSINIRLEAIKSAGMTQLHNQTQDLISRTKQPLFEDATLLDDYGNKKQSIAQIQEAARIEVAVHEALASYSSRYDTFNIKGQVIDVLGVEISPDLKQARVYWCLPRILDLKQLSSSKLEQVVRKMQKILDERGGKIQGIVHSRLRAYYPPKLKWVAAEHVSKDLKRGFSLEKGKKKWS